MNEIFRANNLRSGTPVRAGQVVEIPYHNGYGIHGTNAPSSIGTPVSLWCMRMRNSDIERLFGRLPRGRRVPVTILYEPIRELIDSTTGEAFLEVNFDVYRRIPDWNSALSAAAARVAIPLNRWLEQLLQQPFAGSHILSGNPSVQNNHALVAVGALNIDGQFFLPMQAMERMLGVSYQHRNGEHFLGERRLIAAELQQVGAGVFLAARLIEEVAGRGYFFDALRNTLDLSVSRLVVDGTFVGYNNIFWHSEHGPMVEMAALGSSLRLVFTLGANGGIHVGGSISGRDDHWFADIYLSARNKTLAAHRLLGSSKRPNRY